MQPIFVFSVMRSGSTLLQRILSRHSLISTHSEPWFLLPLLYSQRHTGILTEYGHSVASRAVSDIRQEISDTKFDDHFRKFAMNLYKDLSDDSSIYFLDKTPRYFYVADDILRIFPDAKFIFLWRNPIDVMASLVNTAFAGKWKIHTFEKDIVMGYSKLCRAYNDNKNRCIAIRYEDLLSDPHLTINEVCDYLEVKSTDSMLDIQNYSLKGSLGDPITSNQHSKIRSKPSENREVLYRNQLRVHDVQRLLSFFSARDLMLMGYSKESLIDSVILEKKSTGFVGILRDFYSSRRSMLEQKLKRKILESNSYNFKVK